MYYAVGCIMQPRYYFLTVAYSKATGGIYVVCGILSGRSAIIITPDLSTQGPLWAELQGPLWAHTAPHSHKGHASAANKNGSRHKLS
eukprot:3674073-Karenia_brevis.AAC.1